MNTHQRHEFEALERILGFVTSPNLPAPLQTVPPNFQALTDELQEIVTSIERHAVAQYSGQRHRLVEHRRAMRDALIIQHMRPLHRVAKVLQEKQAGLALLIPVPLRWYGDYAVLAAADVAYRDIGPFAELFISRGFAPDFLTQFSDAIERLRQSCEAYTTARTASISGTAGIIHTLKRGKALRLCFHAIIQRCCDVDLVNGPATFYAWNSVARIHRIDRRLKATAPLNQLESHDVLQLETHIRAQLEAPSVEQIPSPPIQRYLPASTETPMNDIL